MSYHLYSNVGSAGQGDVINLTSANVQMRNSLVRLLARIHTSEGIPVQSMSLVETCSFVFRPSPYFGSPLGTNENMSITDHSGRDLRRKTCAYGPSSFKFVKAPDDAKIEGNTIINHWFERCSRSRKLTKKHSGVITLYRNQNSNAANGVATREDLREYIQKQMNTLRTEHQIRKICVIGDFNFGTGISLTSLGLSEIKDERIGHKHHDSSKTHFIDKIFSNHSDVRIANVFNSVENKASADLGHKCILLRFGLHEEVKKESDKSFSIRKFKKSAQNWDDCGLLCSDNTLWNTVEEIDLVASGFIDSLKKLKDDSMVTRKNNKNQCKLAIDAIEEMDTETMKKPTELKRLAKFFNVYKSGISAETLRPEHKPLHDHLQTKTDNLNVPNNLIRNLAIDEIYKYTRKTITKFPSQDEVKKALSKLSNSNASDIHNLSMKEVKTFLRLSKKGFKLFYFLAKSCAQIGYFPEILKIDKIIFLFKQKGSRMDPSKYRPITLAPAVGKVIEKIMGIQLERTNDKNNDNHAYIRNRSCQSAILHVSEFFRLQRLLAKTSQGDYVHVPIILCEDISSAFESIDAKCLVDVINHLYTDLGEFKLSELVLSYMQRRTFTSENNELLELVKKEITRSAPQGSILSPKFWRYFDCIFSRLYTNNLEDFIATIDFIRSVTHVSYADDHLTAAILKFKKNTSKADIKIKIAEFALRCRSLLDTATRDTGCGINRTKSEVIVPDGLQDEELGSKNVFTWLGYSLTITESIHFRFCPDRASSRFIQTKQTINDIFQHVTNTFARWKIYKVFVAPVLEWFNLTMFDKPFKSGSVSNPAEKLQQDVLCQSIKICRNVNRNLLENTLQEKPVKIKMQLMACNLSKYINRSISSISDHKLGPKPIHTTRSGYTADTNKWPLADPLDLGDRILVFKQLKIDTPVEIFDEYKKKFHFNAEKIKAFTDKTNRAISVKINNHRDERAATVALNARKRSQKTRCRSLGRSNFIAPYSET